MTVTLRSCQLNTPLRCRAGRPQFDTEGKAVIMTDVRVRCRMLAPGILGTAPKETVLNATSSGPELVGRFARG